MNGGGEYRELGRHTAIGVRYPKGRLRAATLGGPSREGELGAVGRPGRSGVVGRPRDDRERLLVGKRNAVDVVVAVHVGGEGNHATRGLPRGEHLVRRRRGELALAAAVGVHDPQVEVAAILRQRDVSDLFAVRRPARMLLETGVVAQRQRILAVGIHHPDVARAVRLGHEDDLGAVRGDDRMILVGGSFRKLAGVFAVTVDDPDFARRQEPRLLRLRGEHERRCVGRLASTTASHRRRIGGELVKVRDGLSRLRLLAFLAGDPERPRPAPWLRRESSEASRRAHRREILLADRSGVKGGSDWRNGPIDASLGARRRRSDGLYQTIVYERTEERIARLTLNRPEKLNAMSPTLLAEFDEALDDFDARRRGERPGHPRRRPLVLRGLRPHGRRVRRPLHGHGGPLGDAPAGRALAAAMELAEADDRAGARPLLGRRDGARRPLRHRFRRRRRAVRPSRREEPSASSRRCRCGRT